MLSGKRAFEAADIAETIASVLHADADFAALPPQLPPSVVRLLRRCLVKDPRKRLDDIADARLDLDETDADTIRPNGHVIARQERRRTWLVAVGFSILASLATAAGVR